MIKDIMLRFDKFLHETEKAYLLRVGHEEIWLPKKLCRKFITNKKLGGNVTIPTFLYTRITGIEEADLPVGDADYIVEKHIPERKEPKETNADPALLR